MLQKITQYILKHKIISLIALVVLVWGGYAIVKKVSSGSTKSKYVFVQVKKDMLISTVSGSGQVSASDSLDLKSQYSGDLVMLQAKAGQEVKKGQLLARIDDTDAQKSVRDAQLAYDSAQLSMEKLQKPADELSLMQAENSVEQAKESLQKDRKSVV